MTSPKSGTVQTEETASRGTFRKAELARPDMSNTTSIRNRWMLPAPKAPTTKALEFLRRADVWARVGLCVLTATILWVVTFGWYPPFEYRVREAPLRNLHSRTAFEFVDLVKTEEASRNARAKILCLYENDQLPLEQLRQALIDGLFEIKQKKYEDLEPQVWARFFAADANPQDEVGPNKATYERFVKALEADEKLKTLRKAIDNAFLEIDKQGLLENLEHVLGQGSMQEVEVYQKGNLEDRRRVEVSKIRIAETRDGLHKNLINEIGKESEVIPDSKLVADRVFEWIKPQLPTTLKWDEDNSRNVSDQAARDVPVVMKTYSPGDALKKQKLTFRGADQPVILAGVPLDNDDIELLRVEYGAFCQSMTMGQKIIRSFFFFGLFAALFSLVCGFLYYRDRHLLADLKHFSILLGLMLITFTLAWILSLNVEWRSEIIPVVIFSMTVAIVYNIELAITFSALLSLAFTVVHGYGVSELVILTAASSTAALLCRTIRSRTKLVYIGLITAGVVFPTVIGANYMLGQPFGYALFVDAFWFAGGAGLAGLIMTAFLPFLEQLFDIHTDISLLELSDANHPLLKELVQRAPGTYNHSINVASISEAAADAIGANGLLCRVGAYFHDIGKIRKPEYFIENQGGGINKHDDLVPTMSTLVIIAHVKDGAEIARTHRLPKRIIDLIEQHHGTTLVEFFYRRAAQQNEESESGSQIDESDFRYPGPRPQTPEAAVMMLADAVESASRALREPTPGRLENLVDEITKKRLDDGQFAECPITVKQLSTIQQSLLKSLNAMYHGRVKYPDQQQTA